MSNNNSQPDTLETAVLFIVFNRPETTKKVFNTIRKAKPPMLYVAADGPREINDGEYRRVEEVRAIATNVDWDCEVRTLFRDKNLGCKNAVSGAIDWFFKQEEQGIILEDDCVPTPTLFQFFEVLLNKYKDDERIMHINGNNFGANESNFYKSNNSYHFGRIPQVWGWATWRRAWQNFDLDIKNLQELIESDFLKIILPNKYLRGRKINRWKSVIENKIDTWDYQWQFTVISNNGLTVVPKVNLISNIGFGDDATHTKQKKSYKAFIKKGEIEFPLNHPDFLIPDPKIDLWYQKHMLEPASFVEKVKRKMKALIK